MTISPGDHIIFDAGGYFGKRYIVARVIKVGKVMWEIEQIGHGGKYGRPSKRRVDSFLRYIGEDPAAMSKKLDQCAADFLNQKRERERKYHEMIASLPTIEKEKAS